MAQALAYLRTMPFRPVTPAFFAALHDAVVEHFLCDAACGRLRLTLRLVSWTNNQFVHRWEQVVLSGIRHGADVGRMHRLIARELASTGQTKLGYRLDEFRLLPQAAGAREQGQLSVQLAIDHLAELYLNCQKITSQEVDFL